MVQPHEAMRDILHSDHFISILLYETHLHILVIYENTASVIVD